MSRPTVAEIDLAAVRHNLRALRSLTAPGVETIAVVKADAYGHGAVPVARTLASAGVTRFAVALVEEATALRDAGVPGTFLVLGALPQDSLMDIVNCGFEVALGDMASARCLAEAARSRGQPATAHLAFDTGMGRVGFREADTLERISAVTSMPGLSITGAMTHFPSADEPGADEFTLQQIRVFLYMRDQAQTAGIKIPLWHAANSAAVLRFPESHLDAIRPGLALYGGNPCCSARPPVELRQVMTFKTQIAHVREMPAGATISYGRAYRTRRPSRIAVLPVGYADGYRRGLSHRAHVLVRGRCAPVVGRVTMDMIMVDVTDIPGASTGDEVVLYGRQGAEEISIEDVAELLDTIPYEVMTAVSARVPRVYVGLPRGSTGGPPTG